MAVKVQASFAAGELDPALHERTTLEKYNSGLKTGRNWIVGKTGRLITRPGRKLWKTTRYTDREVIIYQVTDDLVIEWGHQYMRRHSIGGFFASADYSHALTEDDLDTVHFDTDGYRLFVFSENAPIMVFNYYGNPAVWAFLTTSTIFALGTAPTFVSNTVTGTGYDVDYAITAVKTSTGVESAPLYTGTGKLPINAGENNIVIVSYGSGATDATEIRVYRRPRNAGAYGYVGSSSYVSGTNWTFTDVGAAADYTHSPPSFVPDQNVYDMYSPTGILYQQRLIVPDDYADASKIYAGRIAKTFYSFTRDYPYGSDSALAFSVSASARATPKRFISSNGLVVFTDKGVFLHTGVLSPTNLAFDQKGEWVISDSVPPLGVPGAVFFVDSATNTIRSLSFSTEKGTYAAAELSVYSDHLFTHRRVVSWGFMKGETPLLWVNFSDGGFASFTYEELHEMRAWMRHDTHRTNSQVVEGDSTNENLPVERVAASLVNNKTFFVVEKDGTRYIEYTVPRYVSAELTDEDPEAHMGESCAYMDSMVSFSTLLNDDLVGTDEMAFHAMTENEWDGLIRIQCGTSGLFTAGGNGAVGTIFRWFHPDDQSAVDLTVTERVTDNEIICEASSEIDEDYADLNPRLYLTAVTFTGLDHLEGEKVAVVSDGYVIGSPNNDVENYPDCIVESGSLTLPNDLRGAIVHIGRPITGDLEPLDIATVEQRPVLVESMTVNKLYIKVHKSRGLYVGHKFPRDNKVAGMQDLESIEIDYDVENEEEILANRYVASQTKRIEVSLPGDWKSNGRICIRHVDPVHSEILSIIPDIDDQRR